MAYTRHGHQKKQRHGELYATVAGDLSGRRSIYIAVLDDRRSPHTEIYLSLSEAKKLRESLDQVIAGEEQAQKEGEPAPWENVERGNT